MNYRSIIQNFGKLSLEQQARLKATLSLSMSEEALAFCVSHYHQHERRDPYVDELRMLDALSSTLENDNHALALTEFLTNDDCIAKTYADLLRKRNTLDPNVAHPCTLQEAAHIASAYLFRAGYSNPIRSATLIPESIEDSVSLPGCDSVSAPNSPFRLRLLPFATATPQKGDLLVLLTPQTHEPLPVFQKNAEHFFKNDMLKPYLKGIFCVRRHGLLHELLSITNNLWIDLSAFSELHVPMPMTVLTNHYQGCRILRISERGAHAVPRLLSEHGLHGFIFAQITNDGKFTFSREKTETFSIHPQFMRNLFRYRASTAKLSNEANIAPEPINHRAVTDQNSAYLSADCRINADDVVTRNGLCCSAATARPEVTFFKTAIYTVLTPIMALCASGINYTEQFLSIGLELPRQIQDPYLFGACFAQILGLYRAQAELTLPAQSITICDAVTERPSITAFSVSRGTALPGRFSKPGHAVYCVSPQIDGDGLPDFNSLRSLMERITALGRQGTIFSIKLLCGESITHGLQEMCGEVGYRLTDSTIASGGALDFALLFETDQNLEFRRVATTVARTEFVSPKAATLPDVTDAMNRDENTQIVIFHKKCDSNATALAAYLTSKGVKVLCFSKEQVDTPALVKAILTSQVLILCKDANLPENDRISFALDTLHRAKGCVLSFNEASDSRFIKVENTIDRFILQKITQIS